MLLPNSLLFAGKASSLLAVMLWHGDTDCLFYVCFIDAYIEYVYCFGQISIRWRSLIGFVELWLAIMTLD